MPNYTNITNSTQSGKDPGFKPVLLFAETTDISVWGRPLVVPLALGDKVKIATAHTFVATKGAHKWELKVGSFKHTFESVGDEGAQTFVHKVSVEVLGHNAATIEQFVNMLNDQKVVWGQDADCIAADKYIQLGDDCNPVTAKITGDSKTNSSTETGLKSSIIELTSKKFFYYEAALTIL